MDQATDHVSMEEEDSDIDLVDSWSSTSKNDLSNGTSSTNDSTKPNCLTNPKQALTGSLRCATWNAPCGL